MDIAADEELRLLRSRAYGPAADIERDPAAVRRLLELEALRRGRDSVPSGDGAPDPMVVDAVGPVEPPDRHRADEASDPLRSGPDVERSASGDTKIRDRSTSNRLRRLRKLLWAVSMVASAALAASVTYAIAWIAPVPTSSGAPQIASLQPTSWVEVPVGFLGAGPSSAVFEFHGLTLFEGVGGFGGAAGSECINVITTEQVPAEEDFDPSSWGFDGRLYSGCSTGVFPATVVVPFDSNAPQELRARFPSGRALQFVFDGDRVGVFLDSE